MIQTYSLKLGKNINRNRNLLPLEMGKKTAVITHKSYDVWAGGLSTTYIAHSYLGSDLRKCFNRHVSMSVSYGWVA